MIRLTRRRAASAIPAAFRQPKLASSAGKLVDIHFAALASGKYEFDSAAWKPAKGALKRDTHNKCAYCEASTAVVAHGDVEHFRPKSIYWWLAFAFDNYLFSCQICNQTYKGDKFPIRGARAVAPLMPALKPSGMALDQLVATLVFDTAALTDAQLTILWQGEDADLINPYLEDPEALLTYEADDANEEMWVRSAGGARADRALLACEEVLGLNREELRRDRYVHYLPFAMLRAVLNEQLPPNLQRAVQGDLRRQQGKSQPYAGMKRHFARLWGLPGPR